jgi:acetyl-CoA acetyltransferase
VFRALAQGQFYRFGRGSAATQVSGAFALSHPYGLMSPPQMFAMRYQRWMYENGGHGMQAQKAVSMAAYAHAQTNPRAVMYGKPLTSEKYDEARWIVEPWRLFDCCQENDGAAAVIIMAADEAPDCRREPVYLLGAAQGADQRYVAAAHNGPAYASADFRTVAPRLWEMAGVTIDDVDVIQSYENFTGGVVMSLVEHGVCAAEEVDDVLTLDNLLAPTGRFPLNTSGGNLAECYMHGLGLTIEAIRQIRGESCNQVTNANIALVASGPMVAPVSDAVFGNASTL